MRAERVLAPRESGRSGNKARQQQETRESEGHLIRRAETCKAKTEGQCRKPALSDLAVDCIGTPTLAAVGRSQPEPAVPPVVRVENCHGAGLPFRCARV